MKKSINMILQRIIERKSSEFSFVMRKQNTGNIVSIFREEWHLFTWLENALVPALEIQCSINGDGNFVRAVWFPHPIMITPETRTEFILFANEANIEMHSGGRFWCNDEMDFAYEIVVTEEMIEKCEEDVSELLLDIPYSNYQDFHTPLIMLQRGIWKADTAIRYIRELRSAGVVDNSDYDIW